MYSTTTPLRSITNSPEVLINAANLHVGGGIQVASSVLHELSMIPEKARQLSVVASKEVYQNLVESACDTSRFKSFQVLDTYGFNLFHTIFRKRLDCYSAIFTLFGPLYRWRPPFRSIVGFAQAWIIYPNNECYASMSPLARFKVLVKFWLQAQYFRRADAIVVELQHVKDGLIRELGIAPERIHVIHNCVSSLYTNRDAWRPVAMPHVDCDVRLGFIGRNYDHKNTKIFPSISSILGTRYGIKAVFYVTFTDQEWSECPFEFRSSCINVGPLSAAQCPTFYEAIDAVVFPSLLECFSALPLEAMIMERPLFASDRSFNRDVCGDHAHYFDPASPESAAAAIAEFFGNVGSHQCKLSSARDHAIRFSNPSERAEKYVALLLAGR